MTILDLNLPGNTLLFYDRCDSAIGAFAREGT
jgi:hypothetical protein